MTIENGIENNSSVSNSEPTIEEKFYSEKRYKPSFDERYSLVEETEVEVLERELYSEILKYLHIEIEELGYIDPNIIRILRLLGVNELDEIIHPAKDEYAFPPIEDAEIDAQGLMKKGFVEAMERLTLNMGKEERNFIPMDFEELKSEAFLKTLLGKIRYLLTTNERDSDLVHGDIENNFIEFLKYHRVVNELYSYDEEDNFGRVVEGYIDELTMMFKAAIRMGMSLEENRFIREFKPAYITEDKGTEVGEEEIEERISYDDYDYDELVRILKDHTQKRLFDDSDDLKDGGFSRDLDRLTRKLYFLESYLQD